MRSELQRANLAGFGRAIVVIRARESVYGNLPAGQGPEAVISSKIPA